MRGQEPSGFFAPFFSHRSQINMTSSLGEALRCDDAASTRYSSSGACNGAFKKERFTKLIIFVLFSSWFWERGGEDAEEKTERATSAFLFFPPEHHRGIQALAANSCAWPRASVSLLVLGRR